MNFGFLGAGFGRLGAIAQSNHAPHIRISNRKVVEGSANNTPVGTASLVGDYTGTPSWSLTDASGTFQIDSSTGQRTVLDNTDLVWATHPTIPMTISVSGVEPTFPDLVTSVSVTQVAAVLSSPTATSGGDTTSDLGVSTTKGDGTLYWIVTTDATPPSAANVIAGVDEALNPAAASGSQAVSATGAQAASATGLTNGETYYAYFMQVRPGPATRSNVAASSSLVPSSISFLLLANDTDFLLLANGTDRLALAGTGF